MFKKKNILPLLLLIVTGAFGYRMAGGRGNAIGGGAPLSAPGQMPEDLRDAVASHQASAPGLTMPSSVGEELRDAVAASPALDNRGNGNGPQGYGPAENPSAPRGGSDGNGSNAGAGPGAELPGGQPTPQNISPTAPAPTN